VAGNHIEQATNKYISTLVIANQADEVKRLAKKSPYSPIAREVAVHKEGIPDLTKEVNMTIEQVAIDIDTLSKEMNSATIRLKAMFDSVRLDLSNNKARLERLKQRKDDADLLSFRYNDFSTVLDLGAENFTGSFTTDGGIISAPIENETPVKIAIKDVQGNGYEGNAHVLQDGAYLMSTVDTSRRSNMTDKSLSTLYEYSRITAEASEKIRSTDVNTDTSEALCYITLEAEEEIEALTINSDFRYKMNSIFLSDNGMDFTELAYDFSKVIGGTLVFPSSKYVKLGIESAGYTNDTLAFNASFVEGYDYASSSIVLASSANAVHMAIAPASYMNVKLKYDAQYKEVMVTSVNSANVTVVDASTGLPLNLEGGVTLQKMSSTNSYITLPDVITVNNTTIKLIDKASFPQKYTFEDFEVEIMRDGNVYKVTTTSQFISVGFKEMLGSYGLYRMTISNVSCSDGTKSPVNGEYVIHTLSENMTTLGTKKELGVAMAIECDLDAAGLGAAYANDNYVFITDGYGNVVKSTTTLSMDNRSITVTPQETLAYDSAYRVVISGGADAANGTALGVSKCFEVRTKSSSCSTLPAVQATGNTARIEIPFLVKYDSNTVYVINSNYDVVNCGIEIDGNTATAVFSQFEDGYIFVINKAAQNLQNQSIGATHYCTIE
jgi:hypothetical protein